MADRDLQSQLQAGYIGKLLEVITEAEPVIGRQDITFPRIAVFGDESTGKSSVLESICKIPFPRGSKTTTRCPIQVRLRRAPGVKWSATAWTVGNDGSRENSRTADSPETITQVIRDLQDIEIESANQKSIMRGGAEFSQNPVHVLVDAEDNVDLTLIDLPGYFSQVRLQLQKSENPRGKGDVERVKQTLLKYIRDKNTILLIIIPANQHVKTANILSLINIHEETCSEEERAKFRARTIFCFTKCDLIAGRAGHQDAPHDIEEILSNTGDFAAKPYGWYAVVNNLGDNPNADFLSRMAKDREAEEKFFDSNFPYNKTGIRTRCGTLNVTKKLSSILFKEISGNVEEMRAQCDELLSRAESENAALGPVKNRDVSVEFEYIIMDIKRFYEQAGNGEYGVIMAEACSEATDLQEAELEKCKLGYIVSKRFEVFDKQIKKKGLALDDDNYKAKLLRKVDEARSGRFEKSIPVMSVLWTEVRECVATWKALSEKMCEDIANAAIDCLCVLVRMKAGKYLHLSGKLTQYFENMIQEQKMKARIRLDWLYVDETVRPDSRNPSFMDSFNKLGTAPGLGADLDSNRNAFLHNLSAYIPLAQFRYIDNVVRAVGTHILDVPLGQTMTRVEHDSGPEFVFQASKIRGNEKLEDLMKLRDDIGEKRATVERKIEVLGKLRKYLQSPPSLHTSVLPEHVSSSTTKHSESANGTIDASHSEADIISNEEGSDSN